MTPGDTRVRHLSVALPADRAHQLHHQDTSHRAHTASRLRIPDRQIVGDDGSKVAGLRGTGSPAQILVRMWTKGRSRLAERYCAATAMVNADTSSRAETKGRSHRQIDARDPGRGGRS